jgi:hypothetical protein
MLSEAKTWGASQTQQEGVEAVPFPLDLVLGGCAASGAVERAACGSAAQSRVVAGG